MEFQATETLPPVNDSKPSETHELTKFDLDPQLSGSDISGNQDSEQRQGEDDQGEGKGQRRGRRAAQAAPKGVNRREQQRFHQEASGQEKKDAAEVRNPQRLEPGEHEGEDESTHAESEESGKGRRGKKARKGGRAVRKAEKEDAAAAVGMDVGGRDSSPARTEGRGLDETEIAAQLHHEQELNHQKKAGRTDRIGEEHQQSQQKEAQGQPGKQSQADTSTREQQSTTAEGL